MHSARPNQAADRLASELLDLIAEPPDRYSLEGREGTPNGVEQVQFELLDDPDRDIAEAGTQRIRRDVFGNRSRDSHRVRNSIVVSSEGKQTSG